jgi:transposase
VIEEESNFELILTAKERAMRSKVETDSEEAEKRVRDIRRTTRRQYSAEEKIRIVIAGLRGEGSIAELCRKEGINQNLYYRWSKDFLEAGKKRLAGDTAREATGDEVKEIQTQHVSSRSWWPS